jgi:hypothetical protein
MITFKAQDSYIEYSISKLSDKQIVTMLSKIKLTDEEFQKIEGFTLGGIIDLPNKTVSITPDNLKKLKDFQKELIKKYYY